MYDLRTNMHFTLKAKPLRYEDLAEFVDGYCPPIGQSAWSRSVFMPSLTTS